jgi:hypothetical protein
MKRILLAVAVVLVGLFAVQVYAAEAAPLKMVKPDWHYRWHEGRWWYWMPESQSWVVWTGSTWVPFAKFADSNRVQTIGQAKTEVQSESSSAEPAYWGGGSYGSGYSSSSSGDYSGYGWTWGPGTAFRSDPGRRF